MTIRVGFGHRPLDCLSLGPGTSPSSPTSLPSLAHTVVPLFPHSTMGGLRTYSMIGLWYNGGLFLRRTLLWRTLLPTR